VGGAAPQPTKRNAAAKIATSANASRARKIVANLSFLQKQVARHKSQAASTERL